MRKKKEKKRGAAAEHGDVDEHREGESMDHSRPARWLLGCAASVPRGAASEREATEGGIDDGDVCFVSI